MLFIYMHATTLSFLHSFLLVVFNAFAADVCLLSVCSRSECIFNGKYFEIFMK